MDAGVAINLSGKSAFGVPLAPGNYFVVLTDQAGCGWCGVEPWTGWTEDKTCHGVAVTSGQVTRLDLLYDHAAQ